VNCPLRQPLPKGLQTGGQTRAGYAAAAPCDEVSGKCAPLEEKYRNHALTGSYAGHFECRVQPDWLLIYRLAENAVIFVRTGSHSDLF
jgi:addiction module RelE/StbE family toxin